MFRAWKIGRLFDIGIYVHWTFLLLLAWVFFTNPGNGPGEALFLVTLVATLFGCVVLHELGHALAARHFGIGTRDITLYPIGGVARLERMSDKPWEEFWIAVAGPAVNVVIATVLGIVLAVVDFGSLELGVPSVAAFLASLMWMNIIMVVFNMLPAFPMDGGRVLRAALASFMGQWQATRIAVSIASVFAMLFGAWGVFSMLFGGLGSPMLILIAIFLWFAGQQELMMVRMREYARYAEPEYVPPYQPEFAGNDRPVFGPKTVNVWVLDSETGNWVKQESRACQY